MTVASRDNKISRLGLAIWLLAAIFFLYEFFLRTFVGSLAPQIIPALHLNAATFALLGTGYYIAYGIMQVPVGMLADKFGVKKILIFATLICAIATYLFAHTQSFPLAFASRFMMGLGSAFAFVCLLVVALTWLPHKYFGFFAGLSQFIGTMGPLLASGPLIALLTATNASWRYTFSLVASFGVVLAILVFFVVRDKPRDGERHLIYLSPNKSIKKSLFNLCKNPQVWFVALYSGTNYMAMALFGIVWGTTFLQAQGLSQIRAGEMISLAWLGYAIGCPLVGAISDFTKKRKPTLIFCAALGIVVSIILIYVPQLPLFMYAILLFTVGIACSGQNVGFATISENADLAIRATALGLNNGAITLFDASMPVISAYFISLSANGDIMHLQPHNFFIAFSIIPVMYLIALLVSTFFIKETYCKSQKEMILLQPML